LQKYSFLSVFLKFILKNTKMILVTGATGMVGAHLIWHLLQENERVTATRRHSSQLHNIRSIFLFYTPNPDDYLSRIDWIILDLNDAFSVNEALRGATVVYHCAAYVSLTSSTKHDFEINIASTRNLVEASLTNRVNKFCFVSSIASCGKGHGEKWVDETLPWSDTKNTSEYSRSKYYSEMEVWNGIKQGLDAVIVNPGVIIGASGSITGSSQLFEMIKNGLEVYTNGGSGYVDVRDVVKIMILLTTRNISGEKFILVAENCSNKEVFAMIADGFNIRRPFIRIGKLPMMAVAYLMIAAGKLFNFTPSIDLRMARTSSNREYYNSSKVKRLLGYEFIPINKSIEDVCKFMGNKKGDSHA
jgi:dihydroflavonol-4-reductase